MINHCERHILVNGDMDIYFVLSNISSKFLLYLECYPYYHATFTRLKQSKKHISITKKSDMSITVIYHGMSLTVLYHYH